MKTFGRVAPCILGFVGAVACGGGEGRSPDAADGDDVDASVGLIDAAPADAAPDVAPEFIVEAGGWRAPSTGWSVSRAGVIIADGGDATTGPDAPIALQTAGITVAGAPLDVAGEATSEAADVLAIDRAGIVERVRLAEAQLQQTWTFATPVVGDVVVDVAISGATAVLADDHGLSLVPAAGGSVSYSHATWVDGAGVRTAVPAVPVGLDRLRLTVPAAVVATSNFPAVLDPNLGSERDMDNVISGSPTGENARFPSIAFSGSTYLVVWRDDRDGAESNIYGIRVSSAGAVLDSSAFVISSAAGTQSRPTAMYCNGNFVVVWEDTKLPVADADLKAARVTAAGAVTQIGTVASTAAEETSPRLVSAGTTGLLVYQRGDDVVAQRYNGAAFGAVVAVATTAAVEKQPAAAYLAASDMYLVAYASVEPASDLLGQQVSGAGALVGAALTLSAANGAQSEPSVAVAGGNFVVAFTNGADLYGLRVTSAGTVLDTYDQDGVAVGGKPLVTASGKQAMPALACGTACVLGWTDFRNNATAYTDVYALPLSAALVVGGAEVVVANQGGYRPQTTPAVIAAGAAFFTAWGDARDYQKTVVYGARLSTAAASLDSTGLLLSRGSNHQRAPAIAYSSNRWLVSFGDSRVAGDEIHSVRMSNAGVIASDLTTSAAPQHQRGAVSAYDGTNFIVGWTDPRNADDDVYAARVSPLGTLIDTSGIRLTSAVGDEYVTGAASSSNRTLLVWQQKVAGSYDVYGAILNNSGGIALPAFVISNAVGDQLEPKVDFEASAGVFVVVWQDERAGIAADDIYGARVTTGGVVQDVAGVAISTATLQQAVPEVGCGNGRCFAVWEDRRNGNNDIYGTRLRITGGTLTVEDAAGLAQSTGAAAERDPTVTYTNNNSGDAFCLAWADERNLAATGVDLYGRCVSSTSGAVKVATYAIATGSGDESLPALSGKDSSLQARIECIYQRYDSSNRITRVFARRITVTEI